MESQSKNHCTLCMMCLHLSTCCSKQVFVSDNMLYFGFMQHIWLCVTLTVVMPVMFVCMFNAFPGILWTSEKCTGM